MDINLEISVVGHKCIMQWRNPISIAPTRYVICHTPLSPSFLLLFHLLLLLMSNLNLGRIFSLFNSKTTRFDVALKKKIQFKTMLFQPRGKKKKGRGAPLESLMPNSRCVPFVPKSPHIKEVAPDLKQGASPHHVAQHLGAPKAPLLKLWLKQPKSPNQSHTTSPTPSGHL